MTSKQIKDLIRNQAKKNNIDAQILLRNYMLERLLERIALSKYNSYFILKGGMLMAAMVGLDARSTIDRDVIVAAAARDDDRIRIVNTNDDFDGVNFL